MTKEKSPEVILEAPPLRMVKADYKAMYAAAKSAGKLKRPTYRIHTWAEESAVLIGKVISISRFEGGKFEASVNAYRIETDEGAVSCILGTYTDTQLEGIDLLEKVVCIQYLGKKTLEDDRKVNMFEVDVIGE